MSEFDKKVSIIEIEVDNAAAQKKVEEMTSAILRQKDAIADNNKEIKDLNKANADLEKQVKAGTKTQEEANKEIQQNKDRVLELKRENMGLSEGMKDLNKERANAVKATKLQSNSLDALRKKVADQKKELNGLNTATEEGRKRFDELTKELKANNEQIKSLDQAAGDFKTSIGDYSAGVLDAFDKTGMFSGAIGSLTTAKAAATKGLSDYRNMVVGTTSTTGGLTKATNVFKIALASTGIGLIIIALGSLITFLTSTQRGMDLLAQVTKPVEVIFSRLLGVVQELGEKVFDKLNSAIKDPIGTIKELGVVIVENILNRFKSVLVLGEAMEQLFKGNFKEAAKLGADAFLQMATGVTDATDKISKAINGVAEFVTESVKIGQSLANMTAVIEKAEIDLITSRARLNAEFEKQKAIASDITKSEQERMKAAAAAAAAQDELLKKEQAFLDLKIERMQLEHSLNDTERADEKALAELIAQRTDFEATAAKKRQGALNLENSIRKQLAAEEEKRQAEARKAEEQLAAEEEKRQAEARKAEELLEKEREAARQKEIEAEMKAAERKAKANEDLNVKLLALNEFRRSQENESRLQEAESMKAYYDLLNEIEEENFNKQLERLEAEKALLDERDDLIDEEKAAKRAEFDLQLEQLRQGHSDRMQDIAWQQADEEAKIEADKQARLREIAQKGQAIIANGFRTSNNIIVGHYDKRFNEIEDQFKNGEITERQYQAKMLANERNQAKAIYKSELAAFRVQQAIGISTAIIDTAKSVSAAIAASPLTGGLPFSLINGALGGAQIAKIATERPPQPPQFALGGDVSSYLVGGNRHSSGGTLYRGSDGNAFEVERGEGIFVTKREATNPALAALNAINTANGGRSMFSSSSYLQEGGEALSQSARSDTANLIFDIMENMPAPVVEVQSIMGGINAERESKKVGII
jgi:hypothetical protein